MISLDINMKLREGKKKNYETDTERIMKKFDRDSIVKIKEIKDKRYNKQKKRIEYLVLVDNETEPVWKAEDRLNEISKESRYKITLFNKRQKLKGTYFDLEDLTEDENDESPDIGRKRQRAIDDDSEDSTPPKDLMQKRQKTKHGIRKMRYSSKTDVEID